MILPNYIFLKSYFNKRLEILSIFGLNNPTKHKTNYIKRQRETEDK